MGDHQGVLPDHRVQQLQEAAAVVSGSADLLGLMLPIAQPARTNRAGWRFRFLSSGSLTETLA